MEKYFIESQMLLCLPELAKGSYKWLGTLQRNLGVHIEKIDVIALNITEKSEIKALFELFLTKLRQTKDEAQAKKEDVAEIDRKIAFFTSLEDMMSVSAYEHDVPKVLVDELSKHLKKDLTACEIMYLSAVVGRQ